MSTYLRVVAIFSHPQAIDERDLETALEAHLETLGELAVWRETEHRIVLAFNTELPGVPEALAAAPLVLAALEQSGYRVEGAVGVHAEPLLTQAERAAAGWPRFLVEALVTLTEGATLDADALASGLLGEGAVIRIPEAPEVEPGRIGLTLELCAADETEATLEADAAVAEQLESLGAGAGRAEGEAGGARECGYGADDYTAVMFVRV